MDDEGDKRWTYFRLLCKCPIGKPDEECPLDDNRKGGVLQNYKYASSEAPEEEVQKAMIFHKDCLLDGRVSSFLGRNVGLYSR